MRSPTVFLVFGGLVLFVIVYTALSVYFTANDPVVRAATRFTVALGEHDLAALEKTVDMGAVKISRAGNKVVSLRFAETSPYQGAFSRRPAIVWTYSDLSRSRPKPNVAPVVAAETRIATVVLTNDNMLYLRQIDGAWKVFYIDKPKRKD